MNQKRTPEQDKTAQKGRPLAATAVDPMLAACRDMALQLLVQSFDGFFNHLEEEFLTLAEKSVERNMRDSYFAARAETKTKREIIKTEFRQRFLDAFNSRLSHLGPDSGQARSIKVEPQVTELSLVANDEYEENLTASNMANTFKQVGGDDLTQLESRMARLIPRGDDEEGTNPISPEAICEAMLGACRQLESGEDSRLVALHAFERQLTSQVAAIYKQVNEFLVQQNVLPVIYKAKPRNTSSPNKAPQSNQGNSSPEPTANDVSSSDQDQGMVQVSIPVALASHLDQLLNGQLPANPPIMPGDRLTSEISFLDQLQHRLPSAALTADSTGMHPARDNLVSLLQNTQWANNLGQMDGMTLNLVALLFDRLFEDARLPDAIKGLIGRLQIPVLKVALVDNTFFARKNHPARQLLDRLAETAVDWRDEVDTGNPRFDKLSAIVSWVVANFEDDVSIFEQALDDLESFLLAEADAISSHILEDTEALAASELNELGLATAESLIGGRLFKREIPPLLTEFIQTWWRLALAKAYGPAGENEVRFVNYVAALDDLLWSVEPKQGADERLKLVNCLPGMLKTLEEGVSRAGMPQEDSQKFMSELVHCHAAAIRNGMRAATASAPASPNTAPLASNEVRRPNPALRPSPAIIETVVSTPVEVAAAPVAFDPPPVAEPEVMPKRWEWIELEKADGSVHKLRLTWVSPQGTRFLFTNRDGENGHTFTKKEIESLLQSGKMRRELLSDSLTDDVLDQLRRSLLVNT